MAWNVALYFISALTFVGAFHVYDGCVVQNGLNLTLKGLTVNLTARKSDDPVLNMSLFDKQNNLLWNRTMTELEESRWTPITLSVYPKFELKLDGQIVSTGAKLPRMPLKLVIEGALVMTKCQEGRPFYQLPEILSEVPMTVGDGDEIKFLSSKIANRTVDLIFHQESKVLNLTWNGKNVTLKAPRVSYHFEDPFSLKFNFSQENYKITWGNQDTFQEGWKDGYLEKLDVTVKMDENGESVFVSGPQLTKTMCPTEPNDEQDSLASVCVGAISATSAVVVVLFICCVMYCCLVSPQCKQIFGFQTFQSGSRVVTNGNDEAAYSKPVVPPRTDCQSHATGRQERATIQNNYNAELKKDDKGIPSNSNSYGSGKVTQVAGDDLNDAVEEDPLYINPEVVKVVEVIRMEKEFTGKVLFTNPPHNVVPAVTSDPTPMPSAHSYIPTVTQDTFPKSSPSPWNSNYNDNYDSLYENISRGDRCEEEDLYLSICPS